MKKKGFTLIELLAVIVILAVIMVIAVPRILDVIENSRKSAAKSSAELYVEAIELKTAMGSLNSKKYPDKDDYLYDEIKVDIKGEGPTSGNYSLKNGKVVSGNFCVNGYEVVFQNRKATVLDKCPEGGVKLSGFIKLSSTSGNYIYPANGTFEVEENLSGGTLSCTSSDEEVATCSVSGTTVTVTPSEPKSEAGYAILTIKSDETEKYNEASASYVVTTAAKLSVTANGYEGSYDGQEHGVTVTCSDATITYGMVEGTYDLTENPKFIDAGNYTVYYKIEKEGYVTATGSQTVIINKLEGNVIAPTAKTLTYNGSAQELINAGSSSTGVIQYKLGETGTYSTSIPTATNSGEYKVYYKVFGDKNHNDVEEKSVSVTINKLLITDSAKSLVYQNGKCKTDGTTYNYMGGCYVKGTTTKNYIWYNGFMWRIMGINNDGTVRLITDESVVTLSHGEYNAGTYESYATNEGYINSWLNNYFYGILNSTKSIIKEGNYFCNETIKSVLTSETVRTTCTSGKEVKTKVGIISYDEYYLAGANLSYLNIDQDFWTMTPSSVSFAWRMSGKEGIEYEKNSGANGIRPVINVDSTTVITKGNGSISNYYVLSENKNGNKTGTISDNVTSGEYVKLEGKTYRVVSKETDGVKLILDGYYATTDTTGTTNVVKIQYGSSNVFSKESGIGSILNGEVLSWLGLTNSNKIVETTWYQAEVSGVSDIVGSDYKYTDILNSTNNPVTAKVGLIRLGELLSVNSSTMLTKNYTKTSSSDNTVTYWLMNNNSTSNAWYVRERGWATNNPIKYSEYTFGIRPVIKVKSDLPILNGNGTWNNPYQL